MKIQFDSEKEMHGAGFNIRIQDKILEAYHGVTTHQKIDSSEVFLNEYGRADKILMYMHLGTTRYIVAEFKNKPATPKDFAQLSRYVTCLQQIDEKCTGGILIDVGEIGNDDTVFLYNQLKNNILWGTVGFNSYIGVDISIHKKAYVMSDFDCDTFSIDEARDSADERGAVL